VWARLWLTLEQHNSTTGNCAGTPLAPTKSLHHPAVVLTDNVCKHAAASDLGILHPNPNIACMECNSRSLMQGLHFPHRR
jgi:hypothetical protein